MEYFLTLATHTVLLLRKFQHLVSLHHAAVGDGGRLQLDCGPKGAMCRHHRLCMTGRIGLRHQDSRGTDTSHTSEFLRKSQSSQKFSSLNWHLFLALPFPKNYCYKILNIDMKKRGLTPPLN